MNDLESKYKWLCAPQVSQPRQNLFVDKPLQLLLNPGIRLAQARS
jgi:hypothetical protein